MKRNCPSCHKEIPDESKFCPECGFNILLAETSYLPVHRETQPVKPAKKPKILRGFIIVAILTGLVLSGIFAYNNVLWGKDKIAYDLITKYATHFKDPSSVRLISGQVGVNDDSNATDPGEYGFLCLSAKNGFGAVTTGNYCLMPTMGISDLDDKDAPSNQIINTDSMIKLCKEQGQLNVKKINRALQRNWE